MNCMFGIFPHSMQLVLGIFHVLHPYVLLSLPSASICLSSLQCHTYLFSLLPVSLEGRGKATPHPLPLYRRYMNQLNTLSSLLIFPVMFSDLGFLIQCFGAFSVRGSRLLFISFSCFPLIIFLILIPF